MIATGIVPSVQTHASHMSNPAPQSRDSHLRLAMQHCTNTVGQALSFLNHSPGYLIKKALLNAPAALATALACIGNADASSPPAGGNVPRHGGSLVRPELKLLGDVVDNAHLCFKGITGPVSHEMLMTQCVIKAAIEEGAKVYTPDRSRGLDKINFVISQVSGLGKEEVKYPRPAPTSELRQIREDVAGKIVDSVAATSSVEAANATFIEHCGTPLFDNQSHQLSQAGHEAHLKAKFAQCRESLLPTLKAFSQPLLSQVARQWNNEFVVEQTISEGQKNTEIARMQRRLVQFDATNISPLQCGVFNRMSHDVIQHG